MTPQSPRHIAIIMDGNNRWAKQRGLPGPAGHKAGVERIRDVMTGCKKAGVEVLTLFAFSSENWQRPAPEVDALMGLFLTYLKKEAKKLHQKSVKLRVIGNRQRFSPRVLKAIEQAEDIAAEGETTLVIAADYGGKWDIVNAAKVLAREVSEGRLSPDDFTEDLLADQLSLADLPPVDLLIRTGGECRISNFLLWQAAYSELYFSNKFWPDFSEDDLQLAINDFQQRQRRFGKSAEQVSQEIPDA